MTFKFRKLTTVLAALALVACHGSSKKTLSLQDAGTDARDVLLTQAETGWWSGKAPPTLKDAKQAPSALGRKSSPGPVLT